MQAFQLMGIQKWRKLPVDLSQPIEVDEKGTKISFRVTCPIPVFLSVSYIDGENGEQTILFLERGLSEISFTTTVQTFVSILPMDPLTMTPFAANPLAILGLSLKWDYNPPVGEVEGVDEDAYTELMPAGNRNTDVDRLMMLANFNETQRQLQFQAEVEALRSEFGTPKPADPNAVIEGPGATEEPPQEPV